jgi:dihydroorotase
MKLLIKQAFIADSTSPYNEQILDILILDGVITQIEKSIDIAADTIIDAKNLCISQGWVDIFCHFNDPGAEHKETLETGAKAAAAGGFTDVLIVPNTTPSLHSKSQVEYVVQKANSLAANVHPIGAVTKNCQGKELAEMYDMKASGAVAFSDGWHAIQQSQIMLKALQYVKAFDGIIIQVPDEEALSKNGLINEGIIATQLGLPGMPSIAENLMIARDIELLKYTNSKLHITGVSTAAGVDLIRQAKASGLHLTCSTTPYHLSFTDADLAGYNTNLKVLPPLRTAADVAALKIAVQDGTIDCITSHHSPHHWDDKVCEFEYAKYGMEGLESSAGATLKALPTLTSQQIANLFATNARKIFGLSQASIGIGATACITLFIPNVATNFEKQHIKSLCSNNAFVGKELAAKLVGTIRGKQVHLND